MVSDVYSQRAVRRVAELLRPEAKDELAKFQIVGGNKVYRIPLDERASEGNDDGFVILKLPPGWELELRRQWKLLQRNLVYGEHCVVGWGKKRAEAEIARYREWHAEGLPLPRLIEFPEPYVRVIEGLPHRSYKAILEDQSVPLADKLDMVGDGLAALAAQHQVAMARDSAGLAHPEPGPKNMLYDPQTRKTYWLDLEHPAEYAKMSVEDMAVRGLRFFIFGVLYKLPDQTDAVLDLAVERYEPKRLLWALAANLEGGLRRLPLRLARLLGRAKQEVRVREQLSRGLRRRLSVQGQTK